MGAKSLGLALVAGITAFLIVGVAVTELAQPWIEFSLFLGIPAGFAAGAFAAAAVYLGLFDDVPTRRRRIAGAFAGFGAVFLGVLIVLGSLLNLGATLTLGIAFIVGLVAGIGTYARRPRKEQQSVRNIKRRPSGIRVRVCILSLMALLKSYSLLC